MVTTIFTEDIEGGGVDVATEEDIRELEARLAKLEAMFRGFYGILKPFMGSDNPKLPT